MTEPLTDRLMFLTAQCDGCREPKRMQAALVEAVEEIKRLKVSFSESVDSLAKMQAERDEAREVGNISYYRAEMAEGKLRQSTDYAEECRAALQSLEQAYSNPHSPQHRAACLAEARTVLDRRHEIGTRQTFTAMARTANVSGNIASMEHMDMSAVRVVDGCHAVGNPQPAKSICVACDGCGWCEGSPAFTCERCHGTGEVTA